MLEKLTAADFRKHVGGVAHAVIEEGPDAPLTVVEVEEHPKYQAPGAKKSARTPFTVLLRADGPCMLCRGRPRALALPDGTRIDPVLIGEISAHPNPDDPTDTTMTPDTRVFQICFS